MIRTQIQITEKQARQLKHLSRSEGISVAELVRRFIDAQLAERGLLSDRYKRAARLAGAFTDHDAAPDLSIEHDRYLDEAYAQ